MRPAFLALTVLPLACGGPAAEPGESQGATAEVVGPPMPFEPPKAVAQVEAPGLTESSGIAASRRQPGSWWTLNDSGNAAALYRFDLEGRFLGVHPIPGIDNRDWEDLTSGPCPGTDDPCLYVAEIGDNKEHFEWVAVYAVREPDAAASAVEPAPVVATWRARYPDDVHNAETLLLQPDTGRLYLVTKKHSGRCEVYRFPAEPSDTTGTLTRVGVFQLGGLSLSQRKATGGDFSPDGRRVVIRTYQAAWEWDVDPENPEAHWSQEPRRAWLAVEKQGEAIAYTPEGHLLTTSEGYPMPVNIVRRTGAGAP